MLCSYVNGYSAISDAATSLLVDGAGMIKPSSRRNAT
jgi:hypothetical protein